MESDDTLLTVKAGTSLEAKMIMDKIDDCIHIVESGLNSGIVPNLFRYVYDYISDIQRGTLNTLKKAICAGILGAIKELFEDIWYSKYNSFDNCDEHANIHYHSEQYTSFNVITEEHTDLEKFSTSAQYDLEVVVASIAIVKYLLTSKAFIFDANLLQPVNDEGHYA
jgi:hypothetical protein